MDDEDFAVGIVVGVCFLIVSIVAVVAWFASPINPT